MLIQSLRLEATRRRADLAESQNVPFEQLNIYAEYTLIYLNDIQRLETEHENRHLRTTCYSAISHYASGIFQPFLVQIQPIITRSSSPAKEVYEQYRIRLEKTVQSIEDAMTAAHSSIPIDPLDVSYMSPFEVWIVYALDSMLSKETENPGTYAGSHPKSEDRTKLI